MQDTAGFQDTTNFIAKAEEPAKAYPNSLQRLARHFWTAHFRKNTLGIADELDKRPEIAVLCIVDDSLIPRGIIARDKLFFLLGKPYGRELMRRKSIGDITVKAPVFTGDTSIFTAAQSFNAQAGEYIILTAAGGVFSGIVAVRDLTDFLVDITNKDIEMAGLLQERLIANVDDTKNHNLNINAWSRSAKGISGDFYIIKNLKKNLLFSAICDVSGKGIAASLIVAMAWGYLTGFFLIYDSSRRRLQIADMGHAHSAFIRKNRIFSLRQTKVNFPIGVEVDIDPAVYSLTVLEGDALLIYTDGIPEQDNPLGEEFGEDRLLELTKKCVKEKKELTEMLPACIDDFRRNTPQHDDMTFLFFRF